MPEIRILLEPGLVYHIWTHANGKENLFRTEENYRYFLQKYAQYIHPVAETFAYCLMPNHLHLMVRIREEKEVWQFLKLKLPTLQGFQAGKISKDLQGFENLGGLVSQQFSNLFNAYAKAYNKMYNRKGSLFTPKFHRKLIETDSYFTSLIAYIHNNPIHHGFADDIDEWTYSSWNTYMSKKPTKLNKEEAIDWFGNIKHFIEVHEELQPEKFEDVFEK